jgi:hypothetical protein
MTIMKEKFQVNDLENMPEIIEEIQHDFSFFKNALLSTAVFPFLLRYRDRTVTEP